MVAAVRGSWLPHPGLVTVGLGVSVPVSCLSHLWVHLVLIRRLAAVWFRFPYRLGG